MRRQRFEVRLGRLEISVTAENLFLQQPLVLYLERQVKPRCADETPRNTLEVLSRPKENAAILIKSE